MACSTISRKLIYQPTLFVFLFMPLFFNAGNPELGFEIVDDHRGFSFSLFGATDYFETKININPYKNFPHNISLQTLPVRKLSNTESDDALSTTLATGLETASKVLILITQKEIERRIENQKIDILLQRCDEAIKMSNPIFEKMEKRLSHD